MVSESRPRINHSDRKFIRRMKTRFELAKEKFNKPEMESFTEQRIERRKTKSASEKWGIPLSTSRSHNGSTRRRKQEEMFKG